ncbi:MAG: PadR family transcriptional regulator [Rhizomicrobium sp.]
MAKTPNPNFMAGVPELLILQLLQGNEMYGYEIVQAIYSRSGEVVSVGEGVVYPVLHMLEQDGALSARRRTVAGRSRVYYRLTARGERRLGALRHSWLSLNGAIAMVLGVGDARTI